MPTIHCITLNTAVDHIIEVGEFSPGTTIRSTSSIYVAAGKGVDVAVGVATLGGRAVATGFVGSRSRDIFMTLADEGVDIRFLDVPGHTRTNVTILERCGRETHFQTCGYSITEDVIDTLIVAIRQAVNPSDVVVIAGSVPDGASADILRRLVDLSKQLAAYVILDSSGPPLKAGLEGSPQMIKPNLLELRQLVDHDVGTEDSEVIAAARQCWKKGVERVVVSRGRAGLVLIEADDTWKASLDLAGSVTTAGVGSGDAVVAALAVAHTRGMSVPETLRLAAACGGANVLTKLPGRFQMSDVERLLPRVRIDRLS
jgi:1-phosphofructokinase family hexose kinase